MIIRFTATHLHEEHATNLIVTRLALLYIYVNVDTVTVWKLHRHQRRWWWSLSIPLSWEQQLRIPKSLSHPVVVEDASAHLLLRFAPIRNTSSHARKTLSPLLTGSRPCSPFAPMDSRIMATTWTGFGWCPMLCYRGRHLLPIGSSSSTCTAPQGGMLHRGCHGPPPSNRVVEFPR